MINLHLEIFIFEKTYTLADIIFNFFYVSFIYYT